MIVVPLFGNKLRAWSDDELAEYLNEAYGLIRDSESSIQTARTAVAMIGEERARRAGNRAIENCGESVGSVGDGRSDRVSSALGSGSAPAAAARNRANCAGAANEVSDGSGDGA